MRRLLHLFSTVAAGLIIVIGLIVPVGCDEDGYGFIGDTGLQPGFPPFRGSGSGSVSSGSGIAGGFGGGMQIPAGSNSDITFVLSWTVNGAVDPDVDMWVIEPDGSVLSCSQEGYAMGPTPSGGTIDRDDTGGGNTGFGGPERAVWPTGASPAGTYTYGVRWYTGTGSVDWMLNVYASGNLVQSHSGTLVDPGAPGPPYPEGARHQAGTIGHP